MNDQTHKLTVEIGQLHALAQMPRKDEYAPEIQMFDSNVPHRKNLLRPEYRTEKFAPPRTASFQEISEEQVLYTADVVKEEANPARVDFDTRLENDVTGGWDSKSACGNNFQRATGNWQMRKLTPPPKLDTRHLEGWPRETKFWRELYRHIDDDQILACIGLDGTEETKDILIDFTEGYRGNPVGGTFCGFMEKIQAEFGAISDILKTEKLQQITSFRKKPDWDIRKFWRRFKRLRLVSKKAGVELDESILFTRLISALALSSGQRHMILSFFENSQSPKTALNLQSISIRLFGSYSPDPIGTFLGGQAPSDSENSSIGEKWCRHPSSKRRNTNQVWKLQQ